MYISSREFKGEYDPDFRTFSNYHSCSDIISIETLSNGYIRVWYAV